MDGIRDVGNADGEVDGFEMVPVGLAVGDPGNAVGSSDGPNDGNCVAI